MDLQSTCQARMVRGFWRPTHMITCELHTLHKYVMQYSAKIMFVSVETLAASEGFAT
jgi:hypothetical protein